jgi:replicative DNA helicase
MNDLLDMDAEQAVLACLLSYNDAINHCRKAGLKPEHFSHEVHRKIYACLESGWANGDRVTPVTIRALVDDATARYSVNLLGSHNSVLDVAGYSSLIVDYANRRAIVEASNMAISMAKNTDSATLSAGLSKVLSDVNAGNSAPKMRTAKQVTLSIIERLKKDVQPFSTGIRSLDECMGGGLFPSKTYAFAARKKVGKTILGCTISYNLSKQKVPHLFVCGEMSSEEVHQRMLSRELGIYESAFRNKFMESEHMMLKIAQAQKAQYDGQVLLDAPGITLDQLKREISTAYVNHGIKVFILDYWQLVQGKNPRESEAYHLGEVAQWIANIGRQLDIVPVVLAQMNQEGNIRGGEGLRLAADQVYALVAPKDDPSVDNRMVEMMDTRYTPWRNIGNETSGGWRLVQKGLFFQDWDEPYED